jgi:hypothetical protein
MNHHLHHHYYTTTCIIRSTTVSKERGCHVLKSSWLCQVLSSLRKHRPVTPNDYVKTAASNLVLADGRPYQRPRQDLIQKSDYLFKTHRGLPRPLGDYRLRLVKPHKLTSEDNQRYDAMPQSSRTGGCLNQGSKAYYCAPARNRKSFRP